MLFVTRDAFTKIEPVSHDISKSVEIEPNPMDLQVHFI
jgi:hypothetical protein